MGNLNFRGIAEYLTMLFIEKKKLFIFLEKLEQNNDKISIRRLKNNNKI